MGLQVIGAGLGRTGTLSLKMALEQLGFGPCHHMIEVFAAPESVPLWVAAAEGRPDWDAIFAGFAAAVDYPSCTHWRELAAYYPDARVILSLRDPDAWFDSVSSTIFSAEMLGRIMDAPVMAEFFKGNVVAEIHDRIADRAYMTDYYRRRNEAVIAAIPAERLLMFEARLGWEPLCAFLGVAVPDQPYPRLNSREEMHARQDLGHAGPVDMQQMARMLITQMRQ